MVSVSVLFGVLFQCVCCGVCPQPFIRWSVRTDGPPAAGRDAGRNHSLQPRQRSHLPPQCLLYHPSHRKTASAPSLITETKHVNKQCVYVVYRSQSLFVNNRTTQTVYLPVTRLPCPKSQSSTNFEEWSALIYWWIFYIKKVICHINKIISVLNWNTNMENMPNVPIHEKLECFILRQRIVLVKDSAGFPVNPVGDWSGSHSTVVLRVKVRTHFLPCIDFVTNQSNVILPSIRSTLKTFYHTQQNNRWLRWIYSQHKNLHMLQINVPCIG